MDLQSAINVPFSAVTPDALPSYLADPAVLIIDLRPPAAHAHARLPHALNLSVPSTLLKRPLFSLQRLTAMLPSAASRERFAAYREATRILVYDADTATCNVSRLLSKFKNDGYQGELAWLRGGFLSVYGDHNNLIDTSPLNYNESDDHQGHRDTEAPILRTHSLPLHAFSISSTTAPNFPTSSRSVVNPFYDSIRQNIELADGITDHIPLRLPQRVMNRLHDLPFPWLQRIASRAGPKIITHKTETCRRSVFHTPPLSPAHDSHIPLSPALVPVEDPLAIQFHSIELAEQRRLMNIMQHHSKHSGRCVDQSLGLGFPFSITAGVEKGAKNRYRHIWPFEHARVKLHWKPACGDPDDYVNASYVQPLCTRRRYIATQGPLEATFDDFWQLCWEQNVHVIVMLTKEMEGPLTKCGSYWADIGPGMPGSIRTFGPLKLELMAKVGLPDGVDLGSQDAEEVIMGPPSSPRCPWHSPSRVNGHRRPKRISTIKRTFQLSHSAYPNMGARRIVHLQYLEWPDMNVPDDPRGVLGLIREVERAVKETGDVVHEPETNRGIDNSSAEEIEHSSGIAMHALTGTRPVLLHCSAGVGRTGGFIAVDAVLDAVRCELREALRNLNDKGRGDSKGQIQNRIKVKEEERESGRMQVNEGGEKKPSISTHRVAPMTCSPSRQPNLHAQSNTLPCTKISPPLLGQEITDSGVDNKRPRPLHVETSGLPVPLSTFQEPIWDVIQDMREQRMSLCQTLRQYVFVHAAIIEGALTIVDEERRENLVEEDQNIDDREELEAVEDVAQLPDAGEDDYFTFRSPVRRVQSQPLFSMQGHFDNRNVVLVARSGRVENSTQDLTLSAPTGPITGKRGATPTALLEEARRAQLLHCKRHNDELGTRAEIALPSPGLQS